ncbi:hypothetical protein GGP86_003058 [Salinibacter ruber]|nr:hypothetical protein [Salinibacter ruber]
MQEEFSEEDHVSPEKERQTGKAALFAKSPLGRTVKTVVKQLVPRTAVERVKVLLWTNAQEPTPSRELLVCARGYLQDDVEHLRTLTDKESRDLSI